MPESLHHLLVSHHFLNETSLLAPHLRLFAEHGIGALGDEGRHQQGNRCDQHHYHGDSHVLMKHEQQGAQYGNHPGKQLGKSHQKAVCKLVHIGDHPAHQIAGGMGVQIAQGKNLDFFHGLVPDIPNHPVGNAVVAQIHTPLRECGDADKDADLQKNPENSGEIHLAPPDHQIHGAACQNGDIKRGRHSNRGQQHGERQEHPVAPDPPEHLFQRALLHFLPFHTAASFPAFWNCDS